MKKTKRNGRTLKYGEPMEERSIRLPISLWMRMEKITRAQVPEIDPVLVMPKNANEVIKQALEYLLPLAEAALKEKR